VALGAALRVARREAEREAVEEVVGEGAAAAAAALRRGEGVAAREREADLRGEGVRDIRVEAL
jgi:hypothetical protein